MSSQAMGAPGRGPTVRANTDAPLTHLTGLEGVPSRAKKTHIGPAAHPARFPSPPNVNVDL